jgi:outer membrane lipoprotein-sorting protein
MGELGDVLELLHGARGRFRTLQGTLRSWHHAARSHEAFKREHKERGGTLYALASTEGDAAPPETIEMIVRLWLELPDRVRVESDHREDDTQWQSLLVIDDDTWWSFDPQMGALTNEGDPNHQHGLPFDTLLLDPGQLLGSAELELAGESTVAGRRSVLVRAQPRDRSLLFPDYGLLHHASEKELAIDAERGVLLRVRHLLDGEPYAVEEFTEIAFDKEFPEGTFVFEAPEGETLRNATEVHGGRTAQRPLHEVAAAASFPVFAARSVPTDWTLRCHHTPADERAGWPETVHLFYAAEDASVQINVSQWAAREKAGSATPDGAAWQEVEHDGETYQLWEPKEDDWPMPRQIVFERDGTRVQLGSEQLDGEALLSLAARFEPVSTEPPAL